VLPIDRRVRAFLSILVVISSATLLPACSKKSDEASKQPLTQAQRDSAIAASRLPGAGTVGKALEVSDSAESRANEPIPEP
jgi:hypothetical protein